MKDCSTLQSIPSRRQREHAAAGVFTMSQRSCSSRKSKHQARKSQGWPATTTTPLWGRGMMVGATGMCKCLTFCCLHSLQAFRMPPRRLPVTGGVFSISTESGLLCMKSTPGSGRGSWGDRKSLGGIKGGPFGANKFRYSKSIRIGLRSPDIKPQGHAHKSSWISICRKSEKTIVRKGGNGSWWSCGDAALTLIRRAVKRNSAVSDSSLWPGIPGVSCLRGRVAVLGVALCINTSAVFAVNYSSSKGNFFIILLFPITTSYPRTSMHGFDASILRNRGPNAGKTGQIHI